MRSPTPIGEPFLVSINFTTKQGRSVPVFLRLQLLFSQRRLVPFVCPPTTHYAWRTHTIRAQAKWHIVQVERVLATDLVSPIKPAHNSAENDMWRKRAWSSVHEPSLRAYLLAQLPYWLLFGRCGELTTAPAAQPHPQHSFGGHHHHSGTAAAEQQRAPPPPSGLDVTTHERGAEGNDNNDDDELEEFVRALGLPLHRGGSPAFGQRTSFAGAPPASLAERWIH